MVALTDQGMKTVLGPLKKEEMRNDEKVAS
jgi:hypothetical protein